MLCAPAALHRRERAAHTTQAAALQARQARHRRVPRPAAHVFRTTQQLRAGAGRGRGRPAAHYPSGEAWCQHASAILFIPGWARKLAFLAASSFKLIPEPSTWRRCGAWAGGETQQGWAKTSSDWPAAASWHMMHSAARLNRWPIGATSAAAAARAVAARCRQQ